MGCTWVYLIKIQHQYYSMKEKVTAMLSGGILKRACLEEKGGKLCYKLQQVFFPQVHPQLTSFLLQPVERMT